MWVQKLCNVSGCSFPHRQEHHDCLQQCTVRSGKRWCVPRQDTYPEKRKNQIGTDSELVQRDIDLEAGLGADGLLVGGARGVVAALQPQPQVHRLHHHQVPSVAAAPHQQLHARMLLAALASHDPLHQLFLIHMIADRPRKLQVQRSRGHQL